MEDNTNMKSLLMGQAARAKLDLGTLLYMEQKIERDLRNADSEVSRWLGIKGHVESELDGIRALIEREKQIAEAQAAQ